MAKDGSDDSKFAKGKRGPVARFFRGATLVLDIVVAMLLILTAYAGFVSPLQHGGLWGVFPLGFTPMAMLSLVLFVAQLFFYRKGAFVTLLSLLICTGPLLTFCPMHLFSKKAPADSETFTLLSYNVHQFVPPHQRVNESDGPNPQLEYILAADADIVCLQETDYITRWRDGYLSAEQLKRLHAAYPYVYLGNATVSVYSKFAIEPIHLDNKMPLTACYRVTLPSGRRFTLFNTHLHSMNLGESDTKAYQNLTRLKNVEESDSSLKAIIRKISAAAVGRAGQAQQLMRYVRLYGGPDVIITGDFNDVPGCYTIRTLADAGFRSAYTDAGFGPMITFADRGMMVQIDHTLYRGDLIPLDMHHSRIKASDHYPVISRFALPIR